MSRNQSSRTRARRTRPIAFAVLTALGASIGAVGCSTAAAPPSESAARPPQSLVRDSVPSVPPGRRQSRGVGVADGRVPDGTTVFADIPAVANLSAELRAALREAAAEAADRGVDLTVNSGWRSDRYQALLFHQAVATYGSEDQARQWVARPGTSVHEAGEAVDLGPSSAASWLAEHGAAFGLCQIYDNEPWHFELRDDAVTDGCPATYADPTDDPRMQQ